MPSLQPLPLSKYPRGTVVFDSSGSRAQNRIMVCHRSSCAANTLMQINNSIKHFPVIGQHLWSWPLNRNSWGALVYLLHLYTLSMVWEPHPTSTYLSKCFVFSTFVLRVQIPHHALYIMIFRHLQLDRNFSLSAFKIHAATISSCQRVLESLYTPTGWCI